MNRYKTISFHVHSKLHAELKARLLYEGLPMSKFIRHYIESFLKKDPYILEFIERYKIENKILSKAKSKENKKLINAGREKEKLFNLTAEEVDHLYDIIEVEVSDYGL